MWMLNSLHGNSPVKPGPECGCEHAECAIRQCVLHGTDRFDANVCLDHAVVETGALQDIAYELCRTTRYGFGEVQRLVSLATLQDLG